MTDMSDGVSSSTGDEESVRIESSQAAGDGGLVTQTAISESDAGGDQGDLSIYARITDIEKYRGVLPLNKFQDNNGPILQHVHIHLVFWGSAWGASPTPSAQQIANAVTTILASPYMLGLSQYRDIGRGTLTGTTIYTGSNPPNPFSDNDVATFLTARMNDGTLPQPLSDASRLYCVIMPQGVASSTTFAGEHTFFDYEARIGWISVSERAHYAWVTNDGTLANVSTIFSHELVEACTDPEGTAITGVPGTCSSKGWCEIGDICYVTYVVDGVTVQKYWSDVDSGCIAPKRVLNIAVQRDRCGVGLVEGGTGRFDASFSVTPSWISTSDLPDLTGLSYQWASIGAVSVGSTTGPTLLVSNYSVSETITVVLTVTMPNGGVFSTQRSFEAMSAATARLRGLLCALEDISHQYVQAKEPHLPPGPTPDPPFFKEIERIGEELVVAAREMQR